jgi:Glycosyl transferase family 90
MVAARFTTSETDFVKLSSNPIWKFTIAGCEPTSPAFTPLVTGAHLHLLSTQNHTYSSSLRSQNYVTSYPTAANICTQPDLRYLTGFLMAPASFKGTHQAIPIFSQSRIDPYADILAPSPWYYSGRAHYENEKDYIWKERLSTFFWRGANTNGISINGGWRFHLRERFLRAAQYIRGNVDVGFTDILRCQDDDCEDQHRVFKLLPKVEFEEFFKYKFLPDIDGSAFSGRWIAFLKSRGLPFKLALFREWFDSRLVAWRHFVPLDVRLRQRDFVGVVEWFLDPENSIWGMKVADWGRQWALRTLRDEDAEIYMFRLLLEYGRVMNDDRDHLGYEWHEPKREG